MCLGTSSSKVIGEGVSPIIKGGARLGKSIISLSFNSPPPPPRNAKVPVLNLHQSFQEKSLVDPIPCPKPNLKLSLCIDELPEASKDTNVPENSLVEAASETRISVSARKNGNSSSS